MRSRASVPIAENISAYRVTWGNEFAVMFRFLQKYGCMSTSFSGLVSRIEIIRFQKQGKRQINSHFCR